MNRKVVFVSVFVLTVILMVGCATKQIPMQYPSSNLPPIVRASDTIETKLSAVVKKSDVEKSLADQPKISNFWDSMDIKKVLQDIATDSGVNILCDDTVEGTVSLKLENVPLERALKMVLEPRGYVFKRLDNNNHYLVGSGMPGTPSALALSEVAEVIVTNQPADEVMLLLSPELTPFVKTTKGGHTLAVNAPKDIAERIKKDLAALDPSQPLVAIQVLVTEVRSIKGSSSGIDWSKILNISASGALDLKRGVDWTYAGGLKGDLASSIQALAEQGSLKLRANPKIVVVNGEEGEINIVRDKYVSLARDSGNNDSPYYWRQEFEAKPISSGVIMKVKPQISRNGEISLTLQTEVSDMEQPSDDGKLPVLQRRGTKTVVRVKSGDTVIIGGLHQELTRELRRGLPILGRIPLINFFFSKKEIETQDVELVIFVTPGIVK